MSRLIARNLEAEGNDETLVKDPSFSKSFGSSLSSLPKFQSLPEVEIQTRKLASRLNASTVSEVEYQKLLNERQALLDKKFQGELSRKEENRLEYVRWSLDRIEDAKYGASLDQLEEHVKKYEQFVLNLDHLTSQLLHFSPRRIR
jgi:hypothetical protein